MQKNLILVSPHATGFALHALHLLCLALQPLKNMKPDCLSSATKILTAASDVFDRKLGRRENYIPGQKRVYIRLYERAWANIAARRYRINGKPLLTG